MWLMNDTPPDATRFRKLLLELREELIASQADGEAASGTVELDQARVGRLSRMDALQAQAMSKEAVRRRQVQLVAVKAALTRIEADDYGLCRECGHYIKIQRLEFDPTARLCIACANASE
jgi:DnaK suppressor protein